MVEGKELRKFETEQVNEESKYIDRMSPEEIASLMNRQDLSVIEAVQREVSHIGRAISDAEDALRAGGRIFYIGAGTSGRLGAMVRMGKVYENYMVDLTPTNEKLKARCINIFTDITGLSEEEANVYIAENDGNLKKAILSAKSARGMS